MKMTLCTMSDNRAYAKRLFKHYMATTWAHVGLRIDSDNSAEWDDIIDSIIDAAKEEVLQELEQRAKKQYPMHWPI